MIVIRTSLILIFCTLFSLSYAQENISNKNYFVGGSVSFLNQNNTYPFSSIPINSGIGGIYSNNTDEIKNLNFNISPYIGRKLNNHWSLGVRARISFSDYKANDVKFFILGQPEETIDIHNKTAQFAFGLFSRYLVNPDNNFKLYFEPYASYQIQNKEEYRDESLSKEENANYIDLGINTGLIYQFNERWNGLVHLGGVNYINGDWDVPTTESGNHFDSFGLQFSLSSIRIGVEYSF